MTDATLADREPQLGERTPQPYVGIPAQIRTEADLRSAADRGFPALFGWLAANGVAPAGPPFIRYLDFHPDGTPAAIEVAVPVAAPVDGEAPVCAGLLPAGPWLTYRHVGPYRSDSAPDLAAAHAVVRAWAERHGVALAGTVTEHFRVGPVEEPDPARWETELAYEAWPRRS